MAAFSNPSFIISGSLLDWPGELLMGGMVEKVGIDVHIIGEMAGDKRPCSGFFSNEKS